MAAVSQNTLNWLYRVLGREYRDQNRAYNDIAQTLSQYASLTPKTDVYTYEHGAPALLLQLSGTLPVVFRTETYRFPIIIWIPHAYPLEPPIVYVTPTKDMMVTPGQHVGGEGKVYHHYLAHWRDTWDRASVTEFLRILSGVFAKEPPVKTRQPRSDHSSRQAPPIPPPPEQYRPPSVQPTPGHGPTPPPRPPKQRDGDQKSIASPESQSYTLYNSSDSHGRFPLEPGRMSTSSQASESTWIPSGPRNGVPQRQSSLTRSMLASGPLHQQYQQYRGPPPQARMSQPPIMPPQQFIDQQSQAVQYDRPSIQHPQPQQYRAPPHQGQTGPQQYNPQQPHPNFLPQPQKTSRPPPDLLDSPFDISLPIATNLPAPPVPRNPEKDALLSTLSSTLTQTLHQSISQNASALPSLQAQHQAMSNTYHQLQNELSNTNALSSTLSSNNTILSTSLRQADTAISTARQRAKAGDIPGVDEMVTAPTVVGRQLYDVVCEERGVEAAIWALQEGFVRGRIGTDVWSKQTRNLAREGFRKRYLARKVGRGMGLDMSRVERGR